MLRLRGIIWMCALALGLALGSGLTWQTAYAAVDGPDAVDAEPIGVNASMLIADRTGGMDPLNNEDLFGSSVADVGDLNNDGIWDLAVGAPGDDRRGTDTGAIYLLFMDKDGTVKEPNKIADAQGGLGSILDPEDRFGQAVSNIGDVNRDGVDDLAVGAPGDDEGGTNCGAVYILYMNDDGTVQIAVKLVNGCPVGAEDNFGSAVSGIGDLDRNGVPDLAIGASGDDTGGTNRGAVQILFLDFDGSAVTEIARSKLAHSMGGIGNLDNQDRFGSAVTGIGDLNRDGVLDVVAGASGDDTGGTNRGAVYVLFMEDCIRLPAFCGQVDTVKLIANDSGGFGFLTDNDNFGSAVANVGDLDRDGVTDLAVGAPGDDSAGTNRGAVYLLYLQPQDRASNPPVAFSQKLSDGVDSIGSLENAERFGSSIDLVDDLNRDGFPDLAIGSPYNPTGGTDRGAVRVLFMGERLRIFFPLYWVEYWWWGVWRD